MKVCPNCGEVVSDQVAVCGVCGYEFSASGNVVNMAPADPVDPPVWKTIGFMLLLLVGLYALAALLGMAGFGSMGRVIETAARAGVGYMAYLSLAERKRNIWYMIGFAVMSFLPVLVWISLFYAGKYLARRASN